MYQNHSISIYFAQALLRVAQQGGIDSDELMLAAGLSPCLVASGLKRITPEQFSQLILSLSRHLDDELLGLAHQSSRVGVFALMAREAVFCQDLHAAYHHFCHFYNLLSDAMTLELSVNGAQAQFSMQLTAPEKDPDYFLCEWLMLIWHRFPSWLIGCRIELEKIQFSHPKPEYHDEYELMYPCPVSFDQPVNSLVFETKWLQAPVVQTVETLKDYLLRSPQQCFEAQNYHSLYTRKVLQSLEEGIGVDQEDMTDIASRLNISARTLHRKLMEEGTRFQALKDNWRRDRAIHSLCQSQQSIAEIAYQLGFSEPAAFTRAFKKWTGVAPAAYRGK